MFDSSTRKECSSIVVSTRCRRVIDTATKVNHDVVGQVLSSFQSRSRSRSRKLIAIVATCDGLCRITPRSIRFLLSPDEHGQNAKNALLGIFNLVGRLGSRVRGIGGHMDYSLLTRRVPRKTVGIAPARLAEDILQAWPSRLPSGPSVHR